MDKIASFEALCVRENSDLEYLTSNQLAHEKEVLNRHGQRVTKLISTCTNDAKKKVLEQQRTYLFKRLIAIDVVSRRNFDIESNSSGNIDNTSSHSDEIRRLDQEFAEEFEKQKKEYDEVKKERIREIELRRQEFLKSEQEWQKTFDNSRIEMENLREEEENLELHSQLRKEEAAKRYAEQMTIIRENAEEAERQAKTRQEAEESLRRSQSDERIRQIISTRTTVEEIPNRIGRLEEVRARVEQDLRRKEEDRENARLRRAERQREEAEAREITRLQIARKVREEEEARLQKEQKLREEQEAREKQQLQREQKPRHAEQLGERIPSHTASENNEEQRFKKTLSLDLAQASDASEVDPQQLYQREWAPIPPKERKSQQPQVAADAKSKSQVRQISSSKSIKSMTNSQRLSATRKSKSHSHKVSPPPKVSATTNLHVMDALDQTLNQSSLVNRVIDWMSRKAKGITSWSNEPALHGTAAELLPSQPNFANGFSDTRQPPMSAGRQITSHKVNTRPVLEATSPAGLGSLDRSSNTPTPLLHDAQTQTQYSDYSNVNTDDSVSSVLVKWQKPSKVCKRSDSANILHAQVAILYFLLLTVSCLNLRFLLSLIHLDKMTQDVLSQAFGF